jgi:hypothetical protein
MAEPDDALVRVVEESVRLIVAKLDELVGAVDRLTDVQRDMVGGTFTDSSLVPPEWTQDRS